MTSSGEYFDRTRIDELLAKEESRIRQSPRFRKAENAPLIGLALSGGGIRSASFALGVLHALVRELPGRGNALANVDYLSTVSGGGYTGSSLTWHVEKNEDQTGSPFGVTAASFPLGQPGTPGHPYGPGTLSRSAENLNHIRQRGRYLTPGKGLNEIAMAATVARGVLVSASVYAALMFFVYCVALWGGDRLFEQALIWPTDSLLPSLLVSIPVAFASGLHS